MRDYLVGGRTAATAATANVAGAAIWNASASRSLFVNQIAWCKTVATADNLALVRITTRGTSTLTVTPVSQSDVDFDAAPASGALLDLTYSAQPVISSTAAPMFRWNLPAAIGSGVILPLPVPIEVPAGTGLALITPAAVILQPADVSFFWRE